MERGCDFESDSNRAEPTPVGDDEVNPATPLARVAITRELLSNFVYEVRSGGLFLNAVDEMNSSNDVCDQLRSV